VEWWCGLGLWAYLVGGLAHVRHDLQAVFVVLVGGEGDDADLARVLDQVGRDASR
jgi:hypothetical protein